MSGPETVPPSQPDRSAVSAKIGVSVSMILLAVGWFHTFLEIWATRWFPAWGARDLGLWRRLTGGDSYYTHGPLAPAVCLVLAIYIYRRVGAPAKRTTAATAVGWAGLVMMSALHLLGAMAFMKFLSCLALIGVLGCLLLLWGGWRLLRAYWAPVVFLFFMAPLPMDTIAKLNLKLKFIATDAALWLTNEMMGVPALRDGAYVLLPQGKRMVVENVCGGLRSLIALTFFAALFAVVCRVKGGWRVFMLLMALPVAIGCNIVRITGLNVVAHYDSVEAAAEGAWFHDYSGLFVFILALGVLFGLEALVILLGKWSGRDWVDQRLLPFLSSVPTGGAVRIMQPTLLLFLLLIALASAYLGQLDRSHNISDVAHRAVPDEVWVGDRRYTSQAMTLSPRVLQILQTNDYVYRRYASFDHPEGFDLLIVFSTNIRNGAHSPDVCLEAAGEQIIGKYDHQFELLDHAELNMRELLTQHNDRQTCHYFVFKSGDSYTTSYLKQQITIVLNGLLRRNTAGALIRFTIPVADHDRQEARETLNEVITAMMPQIDQGLRRPWASSGE